MSIFRCYICPKRPSFNTKKALKSHSLNSIIHSPWPYCKPCSRRFIYESALENHLNTCHSRNQYRIDSLGKVRHLTTEAAPDTTQFHCCDCSRDFPSEQSLDQHLRDKVHAERPTTLLDLFCIPCNRAFCNEDALEQHMGSLKHKPLIEELKCITGSECKTIFRSPSGMLHHLEAGTCKSGIDRRRLDQLIKEKDTGSIITSETGLDGRIHSDDDDSDSSDRENDSGSGASSSSGAHASTTTSSGGDSTLGSVDELIIAMEGVDFGEGGRKCPKCPADSTRTYKTVNALKQHMTSAAHAPLSYHCPVTLAVGGKGVVKSFTTFSGMTQHLESGACKGGKKTFVKAVTFVNQKLKEVGFREMKLIS